MKSETVGPKLMYVDPVEGEQRDGVVARGLKIVSSGVAPWPGDRCSDHEPLHAVIKSGELFVTLNVNGASLSPREGRTFNGSDVTPQLLAAFKEVWSMPVDTFFEPLAGTVPEARLETALGFWRGSTVVELNLAARFVSPFLQGYNDVYELVTFLVSHLDAGKSETEAATLTAEKVVLNGVKWKEMHDLPIDSETGGRLCNDDEEQQRTNLVMFFYYMAAVASKCPSGFRHAMDTAPRKPTAAAVVEYIKGTLVSEDPHVFALQEVPASLVDPIARVCKEEGYIVHSAPPAREAGVVTIVKKSASGRFFKGTCTAPRPDMAHRALETEIMLEDGSPIILLNIHSDSQSMFLHDATQGLSAWYPNGPAVVIGDLQIGKVEGGHARIVTDLAHDLGVPPEHLSVSPPLLTRVVSASPFCCQFKLKGLV